MRWSSFNAKKLIQDSEFAATYSKNFAELLNHPIEVHDAYSGMGTGSVTLHRQYNQLSRFNLSWWYWNFRLVKSSQVKSIEHYFLPHWVPAGFFVQSAAGVTTSTACDTDDHCRKVLGSLHQDWFNFISLINNVSYARQKTLNTWVVPLFVTTGISTRSYFKQVGRPCGSSSYRWLQSIPWPSLGICKCGNATYQRYLCCIYKWVR